MSTFGERAAAKVADDMGLTMRGDFIRMAAPLIDRLLAEELKSAEQRGFSRGVEAAAEACDALHDEPLDHSPDTPFDVGTNVGAIKRCEELAAKIRALIPSAPEPKA